MKRRIIVGSVFLLFIAVALAIGLSQRKWLAMGRFRVDPGTNGVYDPFFYRKQITTISNLLCSPESVRELVASSEKTNFRLMEVGPIRSTRGLFIQYIGSDLENVQHVASNACVIVKRFYSTNDPTITITYWDTYIRKPRWRQEVDYWFWRANQEIHGTFR